MIWHDGRLCAFDVETTGVDYEIDRIVTAAIALVGGGQPTEQLSFLIKPSIEIPESAIEVHGITNEHAQQHGVYPDVAVPAILEALAAARVAGYPIVAMNARFDLTMLDREARRYELVPLGERPAGLRVIDPFVTDKWLDQFRRGKRKLENLCEHYRVQLDEAHEAGADAIAAARIAYRMGKHGLPSGRPPGVIAKRSEWKRIRDDLDALHEAQIGWARDQALSLAEYFARQGKHEFVEPVWPVAPMPSVAFEPGEIAA